MDEICRLYQESLGDPAPPETLRNHAAGCPDCREFARRQRALEAKLPAWTLPEFSPDFTLAVMSRLAEENQNPEGFGAKVRRWFQIRLAVPLPIGALASLLLLTSLGLNLFFWNREAAGPSLQSPVVAVPENVPTPAVFQAGRPAILPRQDFYSTGAFLLIPLGNVHFPGDAGEMLSSPSEGEAQVSPAY